VTQLAERWVTRRRTGPPEPPSPQPQARTRYIVVPAHHKEPVSITGFNRRSPADDWLGGNNVADDHGPHPQDGFDRCHLGLGAARAHEGQQIGKHRPRVGVGSKSALGFVPAPF